jgi:hypothetical protein
MSSKRKSPPTKLDGSNGIGKAQDDDVMPSAEIDLSTKSSPHLSDTEPMGEQRYSPEPRSEVHHHNQLNGERMGGKAKRRGGDIQVSRQPSGPMNARLTPPMAARLQSLSQAFFHHNHAAAASLPHELQNLLLKRRKSENYDNVPSIHSPLNHSPRRDELAHNNNQVKSEISVRQSLLNELEETRIKCEPDYESAGGYHNNNHGDVEAMKREMMSSSRKTMNDVLKVLNSKKRGKNSSEQDFESKM